MNKLYLLLLGVILASCNLGNKHAENSQKCYEISYREGVRADTFLVDTCGGRVWRMATYTDLEGEPTVWDEMIIVDNRGVIGVTPERLSEFLKKKGK